MIPIYRAWRAALGLACGVLSYGCVVDNTPTTLPPKATLTEAGTGLADSFTTEGKPTKVVETPWGRVKIYDISNDPVVREALQSVYTRGDATFGDISYYWGQGARVPKSDYDDVEYIRLARLVSRFDLYRLGCKGVAAFPNHPWGEFHLGKQPTLENLGEPSLSGDEQNKRVFSEGESEITAQRRGYITEENKDLGRWEFHNKQYRPPEQFYELSIGPVFNQTLGDKHSDLVNSDEGKIIKVYGTYPYSGNKSLETDGVSYHVDPHHYIGMVSNYSLAQTRQLISHFECHTWFAK